MKNSYSTDVCTKSRAASIVAKLWKRASEAQKLELCQLLAVRAEATGLKLSTERGKR